MIEAMPVKKYRSAEDIPRMERADGSDLPIRIRAILRRALLLCPPVMRRGVRRFRNIEEANGERERDTAERMRRTREGS